VSEPKSLSAEYNRWWKRLTPDERTTLIESGAFQADDPINAYATLGQGRADDNPFDFQRNEAQSFNRVSNRAGSFILPDATTVDEVMAREEATNDPRIEQLDLASIRLRSTLHFILDALDGSTDKHMRLHADIIRIVVGEGKPPRMTELAKRHGITRSAVSLRCRKLLRQLGLEPSCFMRPEADVNAMRVSSILRHAGFSPAPLPPHKESPKTVLRCANHSRLPGERPNLVKKPNYKPSGKKCR